MNIYDRAWRYVAGIESIEKCGGSNSCFAVALALGRGFNLSRPDAWNLFTRWNASNARPPWAENQLRHKLDDAIAKGDRPFGFLLRDAEPEKWLSPRPTSSPKPPGPTAEETAAADRERWPVMRQLSVPERESLASLRSVPLEAVAILETAGILLAGNYQNRPCFFFREGDFCQARAFDGLPLATTGGPKKAVNLKGSRGAFYGASLLGGAGKTGPAPHVLLVEGAVGLLEAVAAAFQTGADCAGWTCLAAISAGSRFSRAPELLARLRDRHVRIIPDTGDGGAGLEGAAIWAAELTAAGASVDGFALPSGAKDLGALLAHPETLPAIFEL